MKKKPNLFDYNNFRTYLPDRYDYAHTIDPANICRRLGLANPRSSFIDMLNGR